MTLHDFILTVFCLVDDYLKQLHLDHLRQRGPNTRLHDSEVITIELIGEFLQMDKDTKIFWHFRHYHAAEFPGLRHIDRSTFVRQAANLWAVKQCLHQHLAEQLTQADPIWHCDSMPVYACQFARAPYCQRFAGSAAFGKDQLVRQTFYGFRLHLRVSNEGIIQAAALAPANEADIHLVWELEPPAGKLGIGDRGYWSPTLQEQLAEYGLILLAPYKSKKHDPDPEQSRPLRKLHWRIETVNGQLADRYQAKRSWARDLWHLCHRVIRKVLSHTVSCWINIGLGRRPLDFAGLLTD